MLNQYLTYPQRDELKVQRMKKVCFCADDFGLNTNINKGILHLLEMHRLHAVSCMTQSQEWPVWGPRLIRHKKKVDIGLHFNLTHYFPETESGSFFSLKQLMLDAWLRRLDTERIYADLQQQWDNFISVMRFEPDFIDGHQHIHQFPVIRNVLIDFVLKKQFSGWIRNLSLTIPTPGKHRVKSFLLPRLGSSQLDLLCQRFQFSTNQMFAGIYDFSNTSKYQQLVNAWLSKAEDFTLVMCHPSLIHTNSQDEIANARYQEFLYLSSQEFIQDCKNNRVVLACIGVK